MTRVHLAKALFYIAAFFSFTLSVYLWFGPSKEQGIFVGMWVPSILALGTFLFANRRFS